MLLEQLLDHFTTNDNRPNSRAFGKTAPVPALLDALRMRCVAHRQQMASLACAEESVALMQVAHAYRTLIHQLKHEENALEYQDLIDRAAELLTTRSMIGWVMRKLDHRIDHILIDEAQDTSPAQWRIVRALVDELIASNDGVGSGGIPRSVLVVGDAKQSIFSFQGAAPKQFAGEEVYFDALLSGSHAPMQRRALTVSYRSSAAVLHLVDAVAAMPEMAEALGASSVVHEQYRMDAMGSVTLHPLVRSGEKSALAPFCIPKEYTETQSAAQKLAEIIAAQVAESNIPPGDVLILVHRRRPMMPALIRALQKRGVPVSGIDRLRLSEHLAVRDILALIAWCLNPADDLALAQVLRSPIIGISDTALRTLAVGRTGSLWEAVQERVTLACHPEQREGSPYRRGILRVAQDDSAEFIQSESFRATLRRCLAIAAYPPYEFLTQLLEVQDARRRFAERFGEEVHEVLDELKSQAARMPASMIPSIAWFHDWMARSERVIAREAETTGNQVRIMTVHGAKGLEAPVVILADTTSKPDLRKEQVYFVENLPMVALSEEAKYAPALGAAKAARKQALDQEYQRLLYVALTRARDALHVYGATNNEQPQGWYETIQQALSA